MSTAKHKGTRTHNEARLDIGNMATSMYAERVGEDTKAGKGALYRTNADARALYFKGVHDVITCLEEWRKAGLDPATLSQFLTALHGQTSEAAPAH